MLPVLNHPWDVGIAEAREIQYRLREKLIQAPLLQSINTIAAVDVSYTRWDQVGYAVLGLFSLIKDNGDEKFSVKEELIKTRIESVKFPYVPGYLSFREIPILLPLFKEISENIDVIIADGQGIAHPRGIGLAAHLGLLFDIASIGCAKSKLIGNYTEPGIRKGDYSDLFLDQRIIGRVLRSRDRCKPLFVSPGHKCLVPDAMDFILNLCSKYRICDPIRRVDEISKQLRKSQQLKRSKESYETFISQS